MVVVYASSPAFFSLRDGRDVFLKYVFESAIVRVIGTGFPELHPRGALELCKRPSAPPPGVEGDGHGG